MVLYAPPQGSTNYVAQYDITNFMPYIEVQYDNGFVETIPDFLNWDFNQILSYCTSYTEVQFDETTPLTTLVYKIYGNTTLTWLVLMYNGAMTPLEIPPGTLLKFPALNQINSYLTNVQNNNSSIGQVVVI